MTHTDETHGQGAYGCTVCAGMRTRKDEEMSEKGNGADGYAFGPKCPAGDACETRVYLEEYEKVDAERSAAKDADLATLRAEVERLRPLANDAEESRKDALMAASTCLKLRRKVQALEAERADADAAVAEMNKARARAEQAEARCREAAQAGVAVVGADGPMDVGDVVAKMAAEVTRLRAIEAAALVYVPALDATRSKMRSSVSRNAEHRARALSDAEDALRAALAPPLVRPKNRSSIVIGGEDDTAMAPAETKGEGSKPNDVSRLRKTLEEGT
jgi:hypothetical protein